MNYFQLRKNKIKSNEDELMWPVWYNQVGKVTLLLHPFCMNGSSIRISILYHLL